MILSAKYVPAEYIISIDATLITVVVVLGVALARTREKIVKLEEWARLQEKRWNGQKPDRAETP